MDLKINHKFKKEETFSKQLTHNLEGCKISTSKGQTRINALHNIGQGEKRIPDITLEPQTELELEYRPLTNPFYIECKLGREYRKEKDGYSSLRQITGNLNQLLRYKYHRDSKKQRDMEKYGDRHVAVTTPKLLKEKPDVRDFKQEYINLPQLIRTLWKLGIGIMYQTKSGDIQIEFNEQEMVTFEK